MDKMPTMQVWRQWATEGKLKGPQALFFQVPKPVEELYEIKTDPHEINNLATSKAHQGVLQRMRKGLEDWRKNTADLGMIPESKLMERMRPGGTIWMLWRRCQTSM